MLSMNRRTSPLSADEKQYYSRHLTLPELGEAGQQKLAGSRVSVVGAGGLGVPVLQYLAAAGTGHIDIIDYDRVSVNNLHRQVLYGMPDVGKLKAQVAHERLAQLNPNIHTKAITEQLSPDNALSLFAEADVIVDCTDNFPARYLINDACGVLDKPCVHGSIFRFDGQVSVFNYVDDAGHRGPDYRDLYPEPPPPELIPNCAEAGVLGVLPGIIGSLQANEAIKILTGLGSPLSGKLLLFDALETDMRIISIPAQPEKPQPFLRDDYDIHCGYEAVPEVSYEVLQKLLSKNEQVQLIDVREPFEHEAANLGGKLIPLGEIPERIHEIPRDAEVIIYCQSGQRSAEAVRLLRGENGFTNLKNLSGGMNGVGM